MRLLLFLLLFLKFAYLSTQTITADKTVAKDNFIYGNWPAALKEYLKLLEKDSNDATYNYRAGICYLQMFTDRDKAVYHLEKAVKYKVGEKDAAFMLAKAYHLNYNFDQAIVKYNEAINSSTDQNLIKRARQYIEMCNYAKKMIENPLKKIEIKNLGANVNSPEPDYTPYLDEKHSALYFSTRRSKGNPGYVAADGLVTSDIFYCTDLDGEWSKSKSMAGGISTSNDEEIVGLTPEGNTMFLNYFDFVVKDDVLISDKQGKQFKKPVLLPSPVNTSTSREYTGCYHPKEEMIFFSSDKPGGKGGLDIYYTKKIGEGIWTQPVNVEELNTPFDDAFPHIMSDGETMYFASEGHHSMGGFDIFQCKWDTTYKKWVNIENIGYPINTVENDYHIAFDNTGRTAYISSFREHDTQGDLDIYEVTFLDVEPRISTVVGKLYYLAPIDYTDYIEFVTCEKEGVKKRFVQEYLPDDTWKIIDQKREAIKEGFEYITYITLEKDGVTKIFTLDKLPDDHKSYRFINIESKLLPKKNYKKDPSLPPHTKVYIDDGNIDAFDLRTGNKEGEYHVSKKSKRFVMALHEGEHELMIKLDGYEDLKTSVKVPGKSSYQFKIDREFQLTPKSPPAPIHYKNLEN